MIAFIVLSTSREESLIPLIFEEGGGRPPLHSWGIAPSNFSSWRLSSILGGVSPIISFKISYQISSSTWFPRVFICCLKKAMVPFRFPQFPLNIDSDIFWGGRLLCACGVAPLLSFLWIDLNINDVL